MVFFVFIKVFYFILVSSLSVPLYASRSLAKDFLSKSVRPGSVRIKNSLKLYSNRNFLCFCIDLLEFLMRQPLFYIKAENFLYRESLVENDIR
jgi:hypothetical protein